MKVRRVRPPRMNHAVRAGSRVKPTDSRSTAGEAAMLSPRYGLQKNLRVSLKRIARVSWFPISIGGDCSCETRLVQQASASKAPARPSRSEKGAQPKIAVALSRFGRWGRRECRLVGLGGW